MTKAGLEWDEEPVNRVRKGGSRVHFVKDVWQMLRALFRIWARLGKATVED